MKNKSVVVLVGVGNLGLRYLEGILKSNLKISIFAYDISTTTIEKAKVFCNKISNKNTDLKFIFNFNEIPKVIELLILSTTAFKRADLILKFSKDKSFEINSWIIEKLLSQSLEDLNKMKKSLGNKTNVWVSHPRREMKWYQEICNFIPKNKKILIEVYGKNWGLVCNAVHFFDLSSWLVNQKLEFVDFDDLGNEWFESKRQGFYEINGLLHGKYSDGSEIKILSDDKSSEFKINIYSGTNKWEINYKQNTFTGPDGLSLKGKENFMSELIGNIVDDIISNKTCNLPAFNDTAEDYQKILIRFIEHWNLNIDAKSKAIPIT